MQVPTVSYPRFVQLLDFRCYSKTLLSGLVVAIGGLQDSLRKASIAALLDYLQVSETANCNESNSRELNLSTDILWVLQHYKRCDRVITPTLKVIHLETARFTVLEKDLHLSQPTAYCSASIYISKMD